MSDVISVIFWCDKTCYHHISNPIITLMVDLARILQVITFHVWLTSLKSQVLMIMVSLPSLVALEVVVLRTSCTDSDEKVGIMITLGFQYYPDIKVHGSLMGPTWGRQDPGGPHVGNMNLTIWVCLVMVMMLFAVTDFWNTGFELHSDWISINLK